MCYIKLTPEMFYKRFGYNAKKLLFEREFNKKNLEQLEGELKCKKK